MTNPAPSSTAFIGLGVMGFPMAGHLRSAGHEVVVYNRTAAVAKRWEDTHGPGARSTPAEAAEGADLVMVCVGNDDDVRGVVTGEGGVLEAMAPGSILIDHTTASAELALELAAACAQRDVGFMDAPVSGGQAGAENGSLTVMCGAEPDTFEQARPVVMAYAAACNRLGGPGAGQRTKMVNQICIAGLLQGLSEGIALAQAAGLDVTDVVDTIAHGAAGSWQLENRAETMAAGEFDFGFALDWMRKDLGICLGEADRLGVPVPVTALVDQFYAELQRRGKGRQDTSSLIELLS